MVHFISLDNDVNESSVEVGLCWSSNHRTCDRQTREYKLLEGGIFAGKTVIGHSAVAMAIVAKRSWIKVRGVTSSRDPQRVLLLCGSIKRFEWMAIPAVTVMSWKRIGAKLQVWCIYCCVFFKLFGFYIKWWRNSGSTTIGRYLLSHWPIFIKRQKHSSGLLPAAVLLRPHMCFPGPSLPFSLANDSYPTHC